jgi:hypothetical protein
MIKFNKYKGVKGFFRKMRDHGYLQRLHGLLIGALIVALLLVGQHLAFQDEVEQHNTSCAVSTYAEDNHQECNL